MTDLIKTFLRDERGAVSTDWMVLTAGAVMLGVSAVSVVGLGTEGLGEDIAAEVAVSNGD